MFIQSLFIAAFCNLDRYRTLIIFIRFSSTKIYHKRKLQNNTVAASNPIHDWRRHSFYNVGFIQFKKIILGSMSQIYQSSIV